MWETINQLPVWLKAILIIAPMGAVFGIAIALVIKIIRSEKVALGKAGLQLEDIENKVDVAIDNQEVIMDELKNEKKV